MRAYIYEGIIDRVGGDRGSGCGAVCVVFYSKPVGEEVCERRGAIKNARIPLKQKNVSLCHQR